MDVTKIVNMFNNGEITNKEMWKMIQEKLGDNKKLKKKSMRSALK